MTALKDVSAVRWLGIASGLWATSEELRTYRKQYGVSIPLTLDASGTLFRGFSVTAVPTVLLVDKTGRILRHLEAPELSSPTALRAAIQNL